MIDAKPVASWCYVNDARPICFLIMKPNYLDWDQKATATVSGNGFLWLLPDWQDHGITFMHYKWECDQTWSQMKETLSKNSHSLDGDKALQEVELDPSPAHGFCKCVSGALLHSLSWHWNQFTWVKMLVSVSLTRRNVIPEDRERGHELELLPSDCY